MKKIMNSYLYSFQKTIEPEIFRRIQTNYSRNTPNTEIQQLWYPFVFTNQVAKKQKSMLDYFRTNNKTVSLAFSRFLQFLQTPNEQNEFIEPKLKNKYINALKDQSGYNITLLRSKVGTCKQLDEQRFQGVFMHRHLNMKSSNYSFESKPSCIAYKMQKKIKRSEDLLQLQKIQTIYEEDDYERIYIEKYDRFVEKDFIIREIYQLDIELVVKFENKITKRNIILGDSSKTTHLLQLERIELPYRMTDYYVTDVDFYMKGNPYTQ